MQKRNMDDTVVLDCLIGIYVFIYVSLIPFWLKKSVCCQHLFCFVSSQLQ